MFGACVHGARVRYSLGFNVNTPLSSTHKRNSGSVETLYSPLKRAQDPCVRTVFICSRAIPHCFSLLSSSFINGV